MIKIKDYKEYASSFNNSAYEKMGNYFKRFEDKDKRGNRIYFKLNVKPSDKIHVPAEISEYVGWKGYTILDYEAGLCRKAGVDIRIGKLLADLGRDDLLNTYAKSKQGLKNTENLSVVVSRHPYDVMGISTNRGWSTCLDLKDVKYNGNYLGGLKGYLREGSLVSYLIRDNDRNINNPVSRILMPFSSWGNQLSSDGKCYGTHVDEYVAFATKFVADYNKASKFN